MIQALQSLGGTLQDDTLNYLEMFVMNIYCRGRPKNLATLRKLRWYLFSKYQIESVNLLPTYKAFE